MTCPPLVWPSAAVAGMTANATAKRSMSFRMWISFHFTTFASILIRIRSVIRMKSHRRRAGD